MSCLHCHSDNNHAPGFDCRPTRRDAIAERFDELENRIKMLEARLDYPALFAAKEPQANMTPDERTEYLLDRWGGALAKMAEGATEWKPCPSCGEMLPGHRYDCTAMAESPKKSCPGPGECPLCEEPQAKCEHCAGKGVYSSICVHCLGTGRAEVK